MTLLEHPSPGYYAPGPPPGTLQNPEVLVDWLDGAPSQNVFHFLSNFDFTPFRLPPKVFHGLRYRNTVDGVEQKWPHPGKIEFKTGEAAFQALKAVTPEKFMEIATEPNPHVVKDLGRTCTLRSDWQDICVDVMLAVLRAKFHPLATPHNAKRLLGTGTARISERNGWNDSRWGVDLNTGAGEDILGTLLTLRRSELRLRELRELPPDQRTVGLTDDGVPINHIGLPTGPPQTDFDQAWDSGFMGLLGKAGGQPDVDHPHESGPDVSDD